MKYVPKSIGVDAFRINAVFGDPVESDISKSGLDIMVSSELWVNPKTNKVEGHREIHLGPQECSRYIPAIGDYYVVMLTGYSYVEPQEGFERNYRAAE